MNELGNPCTAGGKRRSSRKAGRKGKVSRKNMGGGKRRATRKGRKGRKGTRKSRSSRR